MSIILCLIFGSIGRRTLMSISIPLSVVVPQQVVLYFKVLLLRQLLLPIGAALNMVNSIWLLLCNRWKRIVREYTIVVNLRYYKSFCVLRIRFRNSSFGEEIMQLFGVLVFSALLSFAIGKKRR
jgi:hypothetical protein